MLSPPLPSGGVPISLLLLSAESLEEPSEACSCVSDESIEAELDAESEPESLESSGFSGGVPISPPGPFPAICPPGPPLIPFEVVSVMVLPSMDSTVPDTDVSETSSELPELWLHPVRIIADAIPPQNNALHNFSLRIFKTPFMRNIIFKT